MEPYRLSPYNQETLKQSRAPQRVMINECTLREGEQSPGVVFSMPDKERIAAVLDEVGVDRLQIWYPANDKTERNEIGRLVSRLQRAKAEVMVTAFTPDWRDGIDWAVDTGATVVQIVYRSSPHLLKLLNSSPEIAAARTAESVTYARSKGIPHVTFCPSDGTRAEWSTLSKLYTTAKESGADALCIADTVGVATPEAFRWLVTSVKQLCDLPVEIHCHNDFGLALANTMASVAAGADIVETCINGMGDRNGNPALDEVALVLKLMLGVETAIDLSRMAEVSSLVAKLSGQPVSPNKPVVGLNTFTQKLDIHVRAAMEDPLAYQPYLPELVGNRSRVAVGKYTGPYGVRAKLRAVGIADPGDDVVLKLVSAVNQFAVSHKRNLDDEEFAELARRIALEAGGAA